MIQDKKKVVGRAVLDMTEQYDLSATKAEFTQQVTFKVKTVEKLAKGVRLTLSTACGGTC
ncbi:hypothetical protein ACIGFK_33920 [Streptomyces sp. NPDC085524]|uniref:hypothetical protein n=1 Tax=Streptomyces sp. NPDC085524 TaxID=3365728 RepID=UPI0037D8A51C